MAMAWLLATLLSFAAAIPEPTSDIEIAQAGLIQTLLEVQKQVVDHHKSLEARLSALDYGHESLEIDPIAAPRPEKARFKAQSTGRGPIGRRLAEEDYIFGNITASIFGLNKAEAEAQKEVLNSFKTSIDGFVTCLDYMWLLICGALVMFMQAGFAILESGSVRSKNGSMVLMKNVIDACVGTIIWYLCGYGLAYGVQDETSELYGSSKLYGTDFLELDSENTITGSSHFKDWFFQWAFCATSATIVSGGVAERVQLPAYVLFSIVMTGFIYPVIVYWTWSGEGWLTAKGYSDFAGSGIVHLTGGIAALVGAIVVGPRKGRWDEPEKFKPHNTGLVVLGTFVLWFGWYGFNCGSTLTFSDAGTATLAGMVAMNTTISAAAGGFTVWCLRLRTKLHDMAGMCNGVLAGLVAVCAGVGAMEPWACLVTGILGGLAYEGGHILTQKLKIDDPLDAFAVHGCGGIMGLIVRPLLDFSGAKGNMFGYNLVGILAIIGWSGGITALVFVPLRILGMLRVKDEEEEKGGDSVLSPSKMYVIDGGPPAELTTNQL